ncbi:hypothetical protein [Achromobacter xylosoxidans]|uniref:Uncharacterized protein n=1 Tax=Alcaligenes xylosoxydans xylosoxydans TaxID=85698 RepID=A0A1R1JSI1_ALCXX|nr:hypothetical protein [Achromobacter xylosoxidans]OMG85403.1 hypothetical protein BIZ92_27030 [Achromobacter xylosoxidans]
MAGGSKPGERRGGRKKGVPNKATAEIKALAQQHGPEAIATLVSIMKATKQPPAARVAAAKELLDRAYGKSVQPIEGGDPDKPINMALQIAFRRPGA